MPSIIFPSLLSSPIWEDRLVPSEAAANFTIKPPGRGRIQQGGAAHPSLLLSSGDKLIDSPLLSTDQATVLKKYEDKGRGGFGSREYLQTLS